MEKLFLSKLFPFSQNYYKDFCLKKKNKEKHIYILGLHNYKKVHQKIIFTVTSSLPQQQHKTQT